MPYNVSQKLGHGTVQAVKHPDLIYDVGMYHGEDTDFYLKKGFRVVAFEADPALANECRRRFQGALADRRLQIVEGAICSKAAATVPFYRNPFDRLWGTIRPDWVERNLRLGAPSERIEVAVVNFSECLQEFGVPHYLKIDIEGADLLCVEAMLGITPRPDYLSIESNKTDFAALLREFDLLSELGYHRFAVVQQALIHGRPYTGTTRTGAPLDYRVEEGASGPFGGDLPVPYRTREEAVATYRRIFQQYRAYGDDSPLRQSALGRLELRLMRRLSCIVLRRPLPGWYDTHAALSLTN
jgi:FkbM family methyltransferase